MKGYLWGIGSMLLVTLAQLLLKWGMMYTPLISFSDINLRFLTDHSSQVTAVICGLLGYGLSMLCWFLALRYLPLNQAYPLLGISYALVYVAVVSLPWFNEPATTLKTLGAALILLGVWLIHSKANKPD
ncbi:4-amino-4-deoxy-L-arabinose-phosphoundecaprenol flippase subunit ArnF [Candidatus Fukatsuia symbiotica]|uniref:Probable 4-amino-4-deoxy-L-arabinose-phosphoundecaprenol flippase subunit ArnF n=1 Tax=Candidatus Fukatsuia symbiotica TaxID=1878942 RepID=A0A2U8I567_9GAMM|nr:4-amino-4-deoxy-L-arabinose-phosphoundecaprenol flippase subunit ArnF [Candidatus Fukatsuia symbiotica]AWK14282.1 4-amino-4-deoxy-L-arabinose-phospho-UDP flippase [Candidatus Fukatsuia symbiotica]MEA9444532.1 4-amino-4-deoxy-L-arabinose-phosphoundecaprenol flippase subunit ArnF [Candidatus Fukatsuia symbiotica]